MSFFINNTEPSATYFNGNEVSSIYYNGTLVWEVVNFEWGSETAVGDSTWWTTLKKWAAGASAAERAACVGKTKKVSLSTAVRGASSITMRCIAADADGVGTLTFQSAYALPTKASFGDSNAAWIGSEARTHCQNIYNYCSAKSAIKTVKKGCAARNSSRKGAVTYNNETVFLLSERELGLDTYAGISVANSTTTKAECTYGYNAPYITKRSARIKYRGDASGNATTTLAEYWMRSRHYSTSSEVLYVDKNGYSNYLTYDYAKYLVPAFVIG